jgi:hypothetical protein
MAEIVNLRRARKQMKRDQKAEEAKQNRLAHGRRKAERRLQEARTAKTRRDLEAHRLEPGDGA